MDDILKELLKTSDKKIIIKRINEMDADIKKEQQSKNNVNKTTDKYKILLKLINKILVQIGMICYSKNKMPK